MSSYSLSNSAPVNNPGYYDSPIHNQYSNPERNGPYKQLTSHQFNPYVGEEFNSNDDNYEVYQMQSYPSNDLFEHYNNSNHGYTSNDGVHSGALVRRNPQIEHFTNDEYDIEQTTNRLDVNKTMRHRPINKPNHQHIQQHRRNPNYYPQRRAPQVVYNQYLPRQPSVQYNDYYYDSPGYLNVGSIPNIAGLYNQMPKRPETIIVKEVNNDTKITDYDSDDDDDDDSDNSIQTKKSNKSSDSKETKISSLKKKLEKGKKLKKKKNNMMYLVIFLLIIIVGLMLYIILNQKVKKVRF